MRLAQCSIAKKLRRYRPQHLVNSTEARGIFQGKENERETVLQKLSIGKLLGKFYI